MCKLTESPETLERNQQDITEEAQAVVQCQQTEEKYHILFNSLTDAILIADTERTIIDCNPAFTELFGYTLDEIRGHKTVDIYESEAQYRQLGEELKQHAGDPSFMAQMNFVKKTGEIFVGETKVVYVRDQEGDVTALVGLIRDVTERVEMEEALRESNERFSLVAEATQDMVWDWSLEADDLWRNRRFQEFLNRGEPAEDTYEAWAQAIHPDDRERVLEKVARARDSGDDHWTNEYRLRRHDGEYAHVIERGLIVRDEAGDIERMVGAITDITPRVEAEEKLRHMSKVFMEAADPIIIEDLDGNILDLNKATTRVYGWPREDLIGEPLNAVVPPDHHQETDELLARCKRGESVRDVEAVRQHKSGAVIPVLLTLSLLTDDAGEPVAMASIAKNISELKQAEQELRLAKEAAEAANRAKSQFLANMSHELRTPLNAIMGYAQLMERDQSFPIRHQEKLDTIVASGEHLLELINDVLEMSKIEAGRSELDEHEFDVYKLLETLERTFNARAQKKGLQFHLECNPQVPPFIHADERKLRQVLLNLLSNAIKFTAEGGVTLRIRTKDGATQASDEGMRLAFEVEDTGTGIAPEEQAELFEAFEQTVSGRRSQEGTGLGLSISRRFVGLMGGELTFESQPGQGSIFRFTIPVGEADVSDVDPPKPARRVRGLAPGQPDFRILVVEDKKASRDLLVQLLRTVGFQARGAVNGQKAVELWETWSPHLIWMDMRMPVMDGYEATRRIRAAAGDELPILALTATAFEEDRAEVLAAGCDDFVRKPFREATIFDKMAEHLDVEYVYADSDTPDAPAESGNGHAGVLTPDDLADLDDGWVTDLHQAARRGRAGLVRDVVEEIQDERPALAQDLEKLVKNFRFDELMRLSDGGQKNE